jgi:hypothetical protein
MHRGFGALGLTVALAGCAPWTAPLDVERFDSTWVWGQTHPVDQRIAVP